MRGPRRGLVLLIGLLGLLSAAFVYVFFRSGSLAPVPVVVTGVRDTTIRPGLFGVGIVEARAVHAIGPVLAGRVLRLDVEVGDWVVTGQILGEMDPVDLDDRLKAENAALKRAVAAVDAARSGVGEAEARARYSRVQARRYAALAKTGAVSREALEARQQELQVTENSLSSARSGLVSAQQEQERLRAEIAGLARQRDAVRLLSPIDGLVTRRLAETGTTVVAGQPVLEVINPRELWISTRFDQLNASGLVAALKAEIVLRSRAGQILSGRVLRVEPVADAVTEELLARIVFDALPVPMPPLGELAEVTVALPALPSGPVIPGSSVQNRGDESGVWVVTADDEIEFIPVKLGRANLDGQVQAIGGLTAGQQIVTHSRSALSSGTSVRIVDSIDGAKR